jgi:hypothetical protein
MGNTVEIKLTRGFVAIIDEDDAERVNLHKWNLCKGSRGNTYYANTMINGKNVRLHRFIMGITDPKIEVDHRDTNGMNNSKINLRVCSRLQNAKNLPIRKDNKSGYKGVCMLKGRWRARIGVNCRKVELGFFKTKELAALAYNEASLKYHGEFSSPNVIL